MKKKSFLILSLLLLSFIFYSCDNSSEIELQPFHEFSELSLEGVWQLERVVGEMGTLDLEYGAGEVSWEFNSDTNQLTITNNIMTTGPKDIYAGLDTGTYSYDFEQEDQGAMLMNLFIEGEKIGAVFVNQNDLSIDQGLALDGIMSSFVRIEI